MLTGQYITKVLDEHSAFLFRVSDQRLKMKALCIYVMLVTFCQLTCCNIPEDLYLHETVLDNKILPLFLTSL